VQQDDQVSRLAVEAICDGFDSRRLLQSFQYHNHIEELGRHRPPRPAIKTFRLLYGSSDWHHTSLPLDEVRALVPSCTALEVESSFEERPAISPFGFLGTCPALVVSWLTTEAFVVLL